MLVRALLPLLLSSTLLLFGPSAQGDLELDVPAVQTTEPPAVVGHADPDATAPLDPLTESLLISRLETLDREIPGLASR